MILSQEDNSSPALMSRAFSLLKILTLACKLECEDVLYIKIGIKKPSLLYPFYQEMREKAMIGKYAKGGSTAYYFKAYH